MRIFERRDPQAPAVDAAGWKVWATGLALALLSAHSSLGAQPATEPLVPDRPGLYCGSLTVPKGFLHVETGLAFQRDEAGPETDKLFTTPIVFRAGLSRRIEFRVATPGFTRAKRTGPGLEATEEGFGAATLGVKWRFADGGEDGGRPSMALLFNLGLPVGSDFARPAKVEPGFVWAADIGLPAGLGLSTNLGVTARFDAVERDRFAELFFAAALGRSISDQAGLFVEIAGTRPEDGDSQVVVDGGVTYLVNPDVQLDFSATRGLNRQTADWVLSGGISLRFR